MNTLLFFFSLIGLLFSIVILNDDINVNSKRFLNFQNCQVNYISKDPLLISLDDVFDEEDLENITKDYQINLLNSLESIYRSKYFIHSHILYANDSFLMNSFHNENLINYVSLLLNDDISIAPINHPNSNIISTISLNYSTYKIIPELYMGKTYNCIYTIRNEDTDYFCYKINKLEDCIKKKRNSMIIFDPTKLFHYNYNQKNNSKNVVYHTRFITDKQQNLKQLFYRYMFTLEGPQSFFSRLLY
ncbi:hypothetical protein CPAV1605_154 [seawater metagenome]|uniref:Uncharacterized protein n=1 Tax=seawater metagenome TaxID=1561972 RepID=A0A5E8CL82_9ZZZZ